MILYVDLMLVQYLNRTRWVVNKSMLVVTILLRKLYKLRYYVPFQISDHKYFIGQNNFKRTGPTESAENRLHICTTLNETYISLLLKKSFHWTLTEALLKTGLFVGNEDGAITDMSVSGFSIMKLQLADNLSFLEILCLVTFTIIAELEF